MERDSFIFYRSFYEAIKEIPEQEQLNVYKAITEYALNHKEIEITGISKAIFTLIKPQLDANFQKYLNGKKQKGSKTEANDKQNNSKSETNVNENVNVNENENENVSDSCVDGLQEIIEFYNNNIGPITPFGLEILSDYAKEMQKELIILAMKKAVEADIRTIQYIKGILNNWNKKGIKTVADAEKEDKQFKQSSKKQIRNEVQQREYSEDDFNNLYANVGGK